MGGGGEVQDARIEAGDVAPGGPPVQFTVRLVSQHPPLQFSESVSLNQKALTNVV